MCREGRARPDSQYDNVVSRVQRLAFVGVNVAGFNCKADFESRTDGVHQTIEVSHCSFAPDLQLTRQGARLLVLYLDTIKWKP